MQMMVIGAPIDHRDYIAKVRSALDAAAKLSLAIAAETARDKTPCVDTDRGEVGIALEELRESLKALREADSAVEDAARVTIPAKLVAGALCRCTAASIAPTATRNTAD